MLTRNHLVTLLIAALYGCGQPVEHEEERLELQQDVETGGRGRFRLFSPAWRGIGGQDPAEVAKRFEVIFGNLDPAPFRAGNPNVEVIKYQLGPYVGPADMRELTATKNDALARTAAGELIKANNFANWLANPGRPAWHRYLKAKVVELMGSRGFDGILSDSMGTAPVLTNYADGKPINPETGKLYTTQEWISAGKEHLRAMRSALTSGSKLYLNGLASGASYWSELDSSPRALVGLVDGAMAESIFRNATEGLDSFPSEAAWLQDVTMIEDVAARGKRGFWWTKMWCDHDTCDAVPGAAKKIAQWRRFTLGSFLLGAGEQSFYNFETEKTDGNAAEQFPEYDLARKLGQSRSVRLAVEGTKLQMRAFDEGRVFVNVGATPASTELRRRFRRPDGVCTATITVAAHDALMLLDDCGG